MIEAPLARVTIAVGKTESDEIQFMIALDNLCSLFAEKLNDGDAFERALSHITEKWGCDRLPKDF